MTGLGSSLTDGEGSRLYGFGTVNATTFTNSGTIEASAGNLTLTDAVKGTGDLKSTPARPSCSPERRRPRTRRPSTGPGDADARPYRQPLGRDRRHRSRRHLRPRRRHRQRGERQRIKPARRHRQRNAGRHAATFGEQFRLLFPHPSDQRRHGLISLPIPATVADYEDYSSLYDQIPGGFSISDTAANISAGLNSLNDSPINSISISDNGAITVDVAQLTSDATAIGELSTANGSPYQLAVTDTLPNIVGDLSGLNGNSHVTLLDATSGAATLSSVPTIAAPTFTLAGSTTVLTLAEILTYSGSFSAESGATVSISSGDSLTLTGADTFSSATVDGAGTLDANGTTTVSGLTIGGTLTFSDGGTLSESGGLATSVTLGDSSGDVANLTIASTEPGTSRTTAGSRGAHPRRPRSPTMASSKRPAEPERASSRRKRPTTGRSLVSSGHARPQGSGDGQGDGHISGASTLEFGAGVGTPATLGDQDIGFSGGGTLDLLAPTSFYGEISDFGSGDTVELNGSWAFSSISETGGVTTLTLASGSTTHGFEFVGDYTQSDFTITPGTTTTIKYA